jgi:hypothetical protein
MKKFAAWLSIRENTDPAMQYPDAFKALLQKHGNNQQLATRELQSLMSTPLGQQQLAQMKPAPMFDPANTNWQQGWTANSTSGQQMTTPKY